MLVTSSPHLDKYWSTSYIYVQSGDGRIVQHGLTCTSNKKLVASSPALRGFATQASDEETQRPFPLPFPRAVHWASGVGWCRQFSTGCRAEGVLFGPKGTMFDVRRDVKESATP